MFPPREPQHSVLWTVQYLFVLSALIVLGLILDGGLALTTSPLPCRQNHHHHHQQQRQRHHHVVNPYSSLTMSSIKTATALFATNNDDDDDDDYDDNAPSRTTTTTTTLERMKVSGVSVSPNGFHVILRRLTTNNNDDESLYVPCKVTNDVSDAYAATSPESLTLCQLLSGVDMAGTILPPELLSKLVVYHIEEKLQRHQQQQEGEELGRLEDLSLLTLSPQERKIYEAIQEAMCRIKQNQDSSYYKDSNVWLQNRIKLPQITLDQVTLIPTPTGDGGRTATTWSCRLDCAVPEWKERFIVDNVEPSILSSLLYQYDEETSLLFTCIALSIRYKAPIVLETQPGHRETGGPPSLTMTAQQLEAAFPQRTTVGKLQQQSTRVQASIERGFEIHKLQGALTIAMKLGDEQAVSKIRAKLDEYDSMDQLPTAPTGATTTDASNPASLDDGQHQSVDDDDVNGRLDDLDRNILQ